MDDQNRKAAHNPLKVASLARRCYRDVISAEQIIDLAGLRVKIAFYILFLIPIFGYFIVTNVSLTRID